MKKTIIIASLILVAFSNLASASESSISMNKKEFSITTNTPLCTAIMKGDLETIKKFIEYGSDINETSNGLTPLMFAARYNKVDIIKYLLAKGADKNAKDSKGYNALKYAELSKSTEAYNYLKNA